MKNGATASVSRLLILGAGRFGGLAARRLGRRHPRAVVTVVDHAANFAREPAFRGCETIAADGIAYLERRMRTGGAAGEPDWIVPALPLHVAWQWMKNDSAADGRRVVHLPVPAAVAARVPNPLRGEQGCLYASNADFICPDDCPAPERFCTVTGKPRPVVMHTLLAGLRIRGFVSVVIRSRQLAPGVGGYRPADLRRARAAVLAAGDAVLLATACKCHAVVDALRIEGPAGQGP